MSNKTESKHDDLLSIGVENKKHYILIKDFKNLYMIIHCIVEENAFFRYCLQTFSTEKKINVMLYIALKLMVKKMIKMPKKGKYFIFRSYGECFRFRYLFEQKSEICS